MLLGTASEYEALKSTVTGGSFRRQLHPESQPLPVESHLTLLKKKAPAKRRSRIDPGGEYPTCTPSKAAPRPRTTPSQLPSPFNSKANSLKATPSRQPIGWSSSFSSSRPSPSSAPSTITECLHTSECRCTACLVMYEELGFKPPPTACPPVAAAKARLPAEYTPALDEAHELVFGGRELPAYTPSCVTAAAPPAAVGATVASADRTELRCRLDGHFASAHDWPSPPLKGTTDPGIATCAPAAAAPGLGAAIDYTPSPPCALAENLRRHAKDDDDRNLADELAAAHERAMRAHGFESPIDGPTPGSGWITPAFKDGCAPAAPRRIALPKPRTPPPAAAEDVLWQTASFDGLSLDDELKGFAEARGETWRGLCTPPKFGGFDSSRDTSTVTPRAADAEISPGIAAAAEAALAAEMATQTAAAAEAAAESAAEHERAMAALEAHNEEAAAELAAAAAAAAAAESDAASARVEAYFA